MNRNNIGTYDTPGEAEAPEIQPMEYADLESQRFIVKATLQSWKINFFLAAAISAGTTLLVFLYYTFFSDIESDQELSLFYWFLALVLAVLFSWFGVSTSHLCYGYYRLYPSRPLAVGMVAANIVLWCIVIFPSYALGLYTSRLR